MIEKLNQTVVSAQNEPIQLSLYNLIVDYSRSHGIMPYIAKGLYQKYMIERNDFSRLNQTYQSGKYVLDYVNFLSHKERILLYYGLSVHAYSLMYYHDAIELGNYVWKMDKASLKRMQLIMYAMLITSWEDMMLANHFLRSTVSIHIL
ncbi:hypothetical protein P4H50_22690 [Paenibacillus apiarius]|uniref:hypothetical protein n=1 Tax=Paenibacillus apiarius TaxID=46240 RepID=UPI002DBBE8C6|nr:hypothetical protein [Paenibacillus apiarius]MEC0121747.1 hypothetical protein [Paenibacillus apiarius]